MILEVIHLPHLYEVDRSDPSAELKYGLCLTILRDAEENCLLMEDPEHQLSKALFAAVSGWPHQRSKQAREVLARLKRQNRFVVVDQTYIPDEGCVRGSCAHALGLAAAVRPAAVLVPTSCSCRDACASGSLQVVHRDAYPFSGFAKRRRELSDRELSRREQSRGDFEAQVWEPVFRHAKHVRLFDRVVGRKVMERVRRVDQSVLQTYLEQERDGGTPEPLVKVPDNFQSGLVWAFDQFLRHSRGRGIFELTTEVGPVSAAPGRLERMQLAAAAAVLRSFARSRSQFPRATGRGVAFTIHVKTPRHGQEMPHNRYVFTDQIKLMVDRGFDLLDGKDGWINDVTIKPIRRPDQVSDPVTRMPNAPTPAEVLAD